ncbi:hypothetical protein D3C75_984920 [compost metagenome]
MPFLVEHPVYRVEDRGIPLQQSPAALLVQLLGIIARFLPRPVVGNGQVGFLKGVHIQPHKADALGSGQAVEFAVNHELLCPIPDLLQNVEIGELAQV